MAEEKDLTKRYLASCYRKLSQEDLNTYNHGIGTNAKYAAIGGCEAVAASMIHGLADRADGYSKRGINGVHFTQQRVATWKLGKAIRNISDPFYRGD